MTELYSQFDIGKNKYKSDGSGFPVDTTRQEK